MNWVPHAYQREGIRLGVAQAALGLLWDPGLGKTSAMLAIFKLLRSRGLARRMLVIAPYRVLGEWVGEAAKWSEFSGLRVGVLHGPDKAAVLAAPGDVDVINPEGLAWLSTVADPRDWPWDVLCVDESTRFKHTNTQRFKILRPMLPRFGRRYILTGSPAPNGLLDLFGQVYVLDLGASLNRYVTYYRSEFFDQNPVTYDWALKPGAADRIYRRVAPLVHRLDAADHLDLPPLTHRVVRVELPPEARRAYSRMESEMLAELSGGEVTAANAAVVSSKCRQMANGGVYGVGPRGPEALHLHDAKTDAVEEIVDELQGVPALVAYEFGHDLDRLRRRFPDAPHVGGGVGARRFREIRDAWNAGRLPVLLAQPQSVAHGLNLQGTRAHVVEHSIGWDLEAREQFVRRVWRQGQKHAVVVHSVCASGTVDEVVLRALERKDGVQRSLLAALKEYGRSRR